MSAKSGTVSDRQVISTRDNGHIDINVTLPNGKWSFTVGIENH